MLHTVPLTAWLVVPLLLAAYTLFQAWVGRAMGLTLHHIRLGYGPALSLRLWGRPLQVGLLPLGGYALLATRQREEDADAPPGTCLEDLSRARRMLLHLSGVLLLAALAGGLWAAGVPGLAGVCGLLAAANLYPMPGTAGGLALLALWGRPLSGAALLAWTLAGLAGIVGILAAFWDTLR